MSKPVLYGVCLVKDEDDVISQSLTYGLRYCDRIIVIDNGSTDSTWHIVQSLSREDSRIIPLLQTNEPFTNGLRALAYNRYRSQLRDSDWWLVLDADEFLAEDPRPVIGCAASENVDLIRSWQIHFYFTDVDYRNWLDGDDSRDTPIHLRRRYYLINWQETRLFRNRTDRAWDARSNEFFPDGFRRACRRLILNRHYQFRDPQQIQKRFALRFGNPLFPHVTDCDWQSAIVPSSRLNRLNDGDPWRFSASGLAEYYGFVVKSTWRAGLRRLRRSVFSRAR